MTRTQHSFVAPSGLALAVHEWGGTGDPVLLAHPTGFHGAVWQPVAERLVAAGRRVWSFDFRGHGDSDASPDGEYSWDGFADDAGAVLDHLSLRGEPSLAAAGHSKGAAALLKVAMADSRALPSIWAFEPIVFPPEAVAALDANNPMSTAARKRRAVWDSRAEATASYGARQPLGSLHPDALTAYVDYGMRDRADGTVELKCRPDDEANMYMMGVANGIFGCLRDVAPPVLVACGADSRSISPELGARIVSELPNATLEVWDGCGHFGPLEDPSRAAESILRFGSSPLRG